MSGGGKNKFAKRSGGVPPPTSKSRDITRGVANNPSKKAINVTKENRRILNEAMLRIDSKMSNLSQPGIITPQIKDQAMASGDPLSSFESIFEKLKSVENRLDIIQTAQKKQEAEHVKKTPPKPKLKYRPIPPQSLEELFGVEHTTKYYSIKCGEGNKRKINPYNLQQAIFQISGANPKRILSGWKDDFTVEVRDQNQGEKILLLKEIGNQSCRVEKHPFYNTSKAIIYVQEYELDDTTIKQFEEGLKENYNIVKIELAKFIRPKNNTTTPILITFDQETPPDYLYIPGERSDVKVYPYQIRPMMCHICLEYGHTKNRCADKEQICSHCSQTGHGFKICPNLQTPAKCMHCKGEHKAGDRMCKTQITEQNVVDIMNNQKVSRMRAKQILQESTSTPIKCSQKSFTKIFKCEVDEMQKRKLNPWLVAKILKNELGENVKVRSGSKSFFLFLKLVPKNKVKR